MRVIILSFGRSGQGGMETVFRSVVLGLNRNEIETKLFLLGGSLEEKWLRDINHRIIGAASDTRIMRYIKYIVLLPIFIMKFKPDIIVGADSKAVFVGSLIKRLIRRKVKVASWMHLSLTKIKNLDLLKSADFHLAINGENFKQLHDFNITNDKNVYLIHNPVEKPKYNIHTKSEVAHFIYIGRLTWNGQKRVNDLLTSLSSVVGDWKLTILGDGDDKPKLTKYASELGIGQNISWHGWREDPWNISEGVTALILTSEYEGFGMVLVEAMSHGIPCISSNCPTGPSDIIEHNQNGWLYDPRDVKQLTVLIQNIVNDSSILPSPLIIKNSIARFEIENIILKFSQVFEHEVS
ncbi:glycosyltransferase [Paenibacillus sp. YAF4_2]|uniref:glycosyltransferase n=1 Tax=Paenibacillus sp. YAF4_2 TaxID=3233085 RepID=UPI003F99A638